MSESDAPTLTDRVSPDNMGWLLAARQQAMQARIVLAFVEQRVAEQYKIGAGDSIGTDGAIRRGINENQA